MLSTRGSYPGRSVTCLSFVVVAMLLLRPWAVLGRLSPGELSALSKKASGSPEAFVEI
jgi:hypothetical protein